MKILAKRLDQAIQHAKVTGDSSLKDCLERLESWEKDGRTTTLYDDSSPLSFYFEVRRDDGSLWMNGGVLYHGNPDESFAVIIDSFDKPFIGWRIHT